MRIASASIAAAALLASSCIFVVHDQDDDPSWHFASSSPEHRGSGTAASETRNVGDFARVEAGGALELDVRVGAATSVAVRADDNLLAHVRTEVVGGALRLSMDPGSYETRTPIRVEVVCPTLNGLELDGAAHARVGGLAGGTLDVRASGAAEVALAGRVDTLLGRISGAARLSAYELDAGIVDVDLDGAAEAEVAPRTELVADVEGAAALRYAGEPVRLRTQASGAGRVDRR